MANFYPVDDPSRDSCAPGEMLCMYGVRDSFVPVAPHSGLWRMYFTRQGMLLQKHTGGNNRLMTNKPWVTSDGNVWHTSKGESWFSMD